MYNIRLASLTKTFFDLKLFKSDEIELSSENSFSFEKNLDPFKYIILDGVLSAEEFISLTIS